METTATGKYLLVLDLGNTRVKYCLLCTAKQQFVHAESLPVSHQTPHDLCYRIHPIVRELQVAGWCRVSNLDLTPIPDMLNQYGVPTVVITGESPGPLTINYKDRKRWGADRYAAIAGAYLLRQKFNSVPGPIAVIDSGTALTYEYLSADGTYLGGGISPGLRLRFEALARHTAQLPLLEPATDFPLFGQSTEACMQAGVVGGWVGEVTHWLHQAKNQAPDQELTVFLTGGDAQLLAQHLKVPNFVEPLLVPYGIVSLVAHQYPNVYPH
jgi:type III pantothenate kinase